MVLAKLGNHSWPNLDLAKLGLARDKCSVIKGWTSRNTFAKTTVAPVQKNLVDTGHEVEINRSCGIQGQDCGNTSAEWHVRDGLRAGAVCDGAKTLEMTSVLLKSVSETQWHGEQEFRGETIPGSASKERAPQGKADWTDTQWNVVAEHTSRIELGVMLASVAQTRMRYESGEKACPCDVLEADDDDDDPHDGVRTGSSVLCGRNSRDGWICCYLLPSKSNSERNTVVFSQELMAGGYKRHRHQRDGIETGIGRARTPKEIDQRSLKVPDTSRTCPSWKSLTTWDADAKWVGKCEAGVKKRLKREARARQGSTSVSQQGSELGEETCSVLVTGQDEGGQRLGGSDDERNFPFPREEEED